MNAFGADTRHLVTHQRKLQLFIQFLQTLFAGGDDSLHRSVHPDLRLASGCRFRKFRSIRIPSKTFPAAIRLSSPLTTAERRVVDGAVHVGGEGARIVQLHVEHAGRAGTAEQRHAATAATRYSGKIVNTSIRSVRGRAGRRADRPPPDTPVRRRRRRPWERAAVERRAGRAPGSPPPTTPRRARGPHDRAPRHPMSSCTQSSPSGASASDLALHRISPRSASATVAIVDTGEVHDEPCPPQHDDSIT